MLMSGTTLKYQILLLMNFMLFVLGMFIYSIPTIMMVTSVFAVVQYAQDQPIACCSFYEYKHDFETGYCTGGMFFIYRFNYF